jgi:hypothetical protein
MASEAEDEQVLGLTTVLDTLRRRYGTRMFSTAEVATFAGHDEDEAIAFKGALEMASGKALPIISAISVVSRLESLVGALVALDDATVALRYKPHRQDGSFFIARIAPWYEPDIASWEPWKKREPFWPARGAELH